MFVRMFMLSASMVAAQSVQASNFYIGANLGAASQDSKIEVIDNSVDPIIPNIEYPKDYVAPDESVTAQSLFVGYRLGRDIALEFGYVKTDEAESVVHAIDDGDVNTNLLALELSEFKFNYLALVGVWPMGNNWSLNAKLGVASWKYQFEQGVGDVDTSTNPATVTPESYDGYSDNGSDMFVGLGMGYGINPSFDIRAEFLYIAYEPEFVNVNMEQSMTLFFLGAAYHF